MCGWSPEGSTISKQQFAFEFLRQRLATVIQDDGSFFVISIVDDHFHDVEIASCGHLFKEVSRNLESH